MSAPLSRRLFLQGAALPLVPTQRVRPHEQPAAPDARELTVAIQAAPFHFFDEGIEAALDRMVEVGKANTVFVYSHTYYGIPYSRTANVLASDHGVKPRDDEARAFNPVWVRHRPSAFRHTRLRFADGLPSAEYASRDIFSELAAPAAKRGVKVFARVLEPGRLDVKGRVHGFDEVTSIDVYGNPQNEPCRNNPNYRNWAVAMATDVVGPYELDGYQWGSERSSPLSEVLTRAKAPVCFCRLCKHRARKAGIHVERAQRGFTALHRLMQSLTPGASSVDESPLSLVLGLLLRYPEILAWDHQWRLALDEVAESVFLGVKAVRPKAIVGRHLASNATTLDPIFRAANDYPKMAAHADFLKPILYQDVMGPRLRDTAENWSSGIFRGLRSEGVLDLLKAFNGYGKAVMETRSVLEGAPLSAEYVGYETRRIHALCKGRAKIFAGIGVNVPHRVGKTFLPSSLDLEGITASVEQAILAGAQGVVASREYDEMSMPALRAFGEGAERARKKVQGP